MAAASHACGQSASLPLKDRRGEERGIRLPQLAYADLERRGTPMASQGGFKGIERHRAEMAVACYRDNRPGFCPGRIVGLRW